MTIIFVQIIIYNSLGLVWKVLEYCVLSLIFYLYFIIIIAIAIIMVSIFKVIILDIIMVLANNIMGSKIFIDNLIISN